MREGGREGREGEGGCVCVCVCVCEREGDSPAEDV